MQSQHTPENGPTSFRSQAEIRAEIDAFVRRVVPVKADNVEVMLTHFKDPEDELVETLPTMTDRRITTRARFALQKTAKLKVKVRALVAKEDELEEQGFEVDVATSMEEGRAQ